MDLIQAMRADCCTTDLKGKSKADVLDQLATLACRHPALAGIERSRVLQGLVAREAKSTTGFGKGIAIPHAQIEGLTQFVVAVAVSWWGVPFESLDRRRCRIFVVILGPAGSQTEHLKALAALSRLLNQEELRKELLRSKSGFGVYGAITRRIAEAGSAQQRAEKRLFMVVLYYEDLLYEILEYFLAQGVEGATVTDGLGMGHYISNIPMAAEFIGFMNPRKNESKTISAIIAADQEEKLVAGIEGITGDLTKSQGAVIISLEIAYTKGTMKMM